MPGSSNIKFVFNRFEGRSIVHIGRFWKWKVRAEVNPGVGEKEDVRSWQFSIPTRVAIARGLVVTELRTQGVGKDGCPHHAALARVV